MQCQHAARTQPTFGALNENQTQARGHEDVCSFVRGNALAAHLVVLVLFRDVLRNAQGAYLRYER